MMMNRLSMIALAIAVVTAISSVPPLGAAIKPMTLSELMAISTGAIEGQIIAKEPLKIFDPADNMDEIWTRLTISGRELTTGQTATLDLYYMGGALNGERELAVTSPRDHQTRVGARVVAFYWFDPSLTASGANKIFCYANIYQVQQGAEEPTVVGLGEGAAVPFNTKLSTLSAQIAEIHRAQKSNVEDGRERGR